ASGGLPLPRAGGRRRPARPLPGRRPPRGAPRRAAGGGPLPAHHRAPGVVRDRADRGDGLRPAGDRERLPGGAGGRGRARDGAPGPARRSAGGGGRPARARRGRARGPPAHGPGGPGEGGAPVGLAAAARPDGRRLRGRDRRAAQAAREGLRVRLLLVSYFYPPGRDTGGQRPAAMAKYLRRLGHEVTVLTTDAYGRGAADEAQVVRARDARRLRGGTAAALYDADTYSGRPHPLSRLLVPEPLVATWAPFARRAALRLLRQRELDAVITTSPPESVHLVGRALSRRGLPWVADLRDGWTFEPLRPPFPTGLQRRLDAALERRWLGAADAVVCVSEPAAADLRRRLGLAPALVPNGWDPEAEVAGPEAVAGILDAERVSLVYTGRFGSYGRDPSGLVAGLRRLAREDPGGAARLELVLAGPLTPAEAELMRADVAPARIVIAGSLERPRALALQRQADALLLIAHPSRSQLLNFKLFEYLAAGRPILALAAGTEAGRLAAAAGCEVASAADEVEIATALRRLASGELAPPRPEAVAEHTYPRPAEAMARVVEAAIARARARP